MSTYRRAPLATYYQNGGISVEPPAGGVLFQLGGAGKRIWELLEYPVTFDELCRRLGTEFAGETEEIAGEVDRFLKNLSSRGMVEAPASPPAPEDALRHRYLWLLKRALVNLIYPEHELRIEHLEEQLSRDLEKKDLQRYLRDIGRLHPDLLEKLTAAKSDGRVWHGTATRFSHTMIGLVRLDNLERCAEAVFRENVPGDFLEAGVCQGGAAIFLRALQVAYGEADRLTWAADSFQGLPKPSLDVDVAGDMDYSESRQPWLSFGLDTVTDHFRRYGLLDENVLFLPGWFSETLPHAPVERVAILRIDADMYQSTQEVLESLYDRVSPGGFVIIDDYGAFEPCRRAVDEFRESRAVRAPLNRIDWSGVFWKKPA